jgi:hypothetical protein
MTAWRKQPWDFVVTVQIPCSSCNVLKPQLELANRSSYVYGEGWLKVNQCCQPCFEKARLELNARVKVRNEGEYYD